jgi:hypothetical protein
VPDILTLELLRNATESTRVDQFFDDDGDGVVSDADAKVVQILNAAEDEAYSRMARAGWTPQNVIDLAADDASFRQHLCFVAMELAAEARPEFCTEEGRGPFWAQYERALAYFVNVAKGKQRSRGEGAAGGNPHIGGTIQPKPPAGDFVFAPSKSYPSGRGGF